MCDPMSATVKKVLVIGLDCAEPSLMFEQWRDQLPNISALMKQGAWTTMRSTVPPITVPAWSSMMSSKDPGTLGVYGFRNRKDYSYSGLFFATSTSIREPRLWDILSQAGKHVVVLGVPQTYPPSKVNGVMVSCFLTPDPATTQYTYPPELREEIDAVLGKNQYLVDVSDYRTEKRDQLLKEIYDMTERRFKLARHFIKTKPWDFFMLVEMGVDRIHHAFWKFFDPRHRKFEPNSPFANAIRDYLIFCDRQIGELIASIPAADRDKTAIVVVSDHGGKRIDGGIAVNEWLIREGYLSVTEYPTTPKPLGKLVAEGKVDWSRTRCWSEGGYYARVFLNVRGREPNGIIEPGDYEKVRDELIGRLEALGDENGKPIGTRVYRPQELYRDCRGVAPDLVAIFGDLYWRSIGSIGYNAIHVFENDTGPDDANHAQEGMFLLAAPQFAKGKIPSINILDVAPTLLTLYGLPVPADMQGIALRGQTI
jgi:predicted AlkP superfamily phosphohydrolase/phosphomutase